jgi:hypothetical protein
MSWKIQHYERLGDVKISSESTPGVNSRLLGEALTGEEIACDLSSGVCRSRPCLLADATTFV